MKKNRFRIWGSTFTACLMLTALVLTMFPLPAQAAEMGTGSAQHWNIMLVIDGSGSLTSRGSDGKLKPTDPTGLRYEAIASFLSVLQDNGHNVGAIVFSGNKTTQDNNEGMRSGIMMDTGIRQITGKSDKDKILEAIVDAGVDNKKESSTDIGTALLQAAEELSNMDNGLPSAVFLFSDGKTEFYHKNANKQNLLARSMDNRDKAIELLRTNNIQLCGAYLNNNGEHNEKELQDIVCQTHDLTPLDPEFAIHYVEITDAASCMASTDVFLSLLGYGLEFGDAEDRREFFVPGIGVDEVNVRIRTRNGETLPDGLIVTMEQPDGVTLGIDQLSPICDTQRTYRNYKIVKPMPGLWKVNVTRPEDSEIDVICNPITTKTLLTAQMTTMPIIDNVLRGRPFTTDFTLVSNDVPVTNPAAYEGYTCTFTVKDMVTGETQLFDIPMDENDRFTKEITANRYGQWEVSAEFHVDERYAWENLSRKTDVQNWNIQNHKPIVEDYVTLKYTYSIFSHKDQTIQLLDYASDMEDGDRLNFTYLVEDCNPEAITQDGSSLTIKPADVDDGKVKVLVTDMDGGESIITFTVKTTSTTALIIIGFLLLVVGILYGIYYYIHKRIWPQGTCQLDLTINSLTGAVGSQMYKVDLAAPGFNGTRHNTNLYAMIVGDLNQGAYSYLKPLIEKQGLTVEEFRSQLNADRKIYESYRIRCVVQKETGEDGVERKTALLKFIDTANKSSAILGQKNGAPVMANVNTNQQTIFITFNYQPE